MIKTTLTRTMTTLPRNFFPSLSTGRDFSDLSRQDYAKSMLKTSAIATGVIAAGCVMPDSVGVGIIAGVGKYIFGKPINQIAKSITGANRIQDREYVRTIITKPFSTTITGPLAEEIQFRLVMQDQIMGSLLEAASIAPEYAGPTALVTSSIAFGAMHLASAIVSGSRDPGFKAQSINAAFGGLFFGTVYNELGFIAAVAGHSANNILALGVGHITKMSK